MGPTAATSIGTVGNAPSKILLPHSERFYRRGFPLLSQCWSYIHMNIDFVDNFAPLSDGPENPMPEKGASPSVPPKAHKLPLFPMGRLIATPNALVNLSPNDISLALRRHLCGDWGELDKHDIEVNNQALAHGGRLLSVYSSVSGIRFYVITEADRKSTSVLLPEDY